ncbi:hypothetical protein ABT364_13585 [Massilia sp. SR12]
MGSAVLLMLALAAAQPVEYEREGGTGTLTITTDAKGVKKFTISTFGANAHTCELGGTIQGTVGRLDEREPGQPECRILFARTGNVIDVKPQSDDACAGLCGLRATFDGRYMVPPAACVPAASKASKESFLALYKAKSYQQAYDALNKWYKACGHLQHWMELDRARNDLALTQYHMKQSAACRATLAPTMAAEMKTLKAVQEELAPLDYEAYAGTAKATFHNLKLCSK